MEILKEKMLKVLDAFVEICEQYQLQYYLAAGSALGAVRHQGMIPWDDDIDVIMPRPDYNRLISLASTINVGDYNILYVDNNPNYYLPYAKICDVNTTIIEHRGNPCNIGVNIDIFPLDGTSSDKHEAEQLYKKYKRLASELSQLRRKYYLKDYLYLIKKLRFRSIFRYFVLNSNKSHYTKIVSQGLDEVSNLYSYDDSEMVINYIEYWGFEKGYFPKSWFSKGTKHVFEGKKRNIAMEYDKYLTKMYGNYMKFPPLEKRVSHHNFYYVDLEKNINLRK